jgi:glycosyltransferase involved in cell wall biosynthesis
MRRILFVNDFAEMGGAEQALAELLTGLDRQEFMPEVLLFENGPLATALNAKGVKVSTILFPQEFLRLPMGARILQSVRLLKLGLLVAWKIRAVVPWIEAARCEVVVTNSLKALLITWIALRFVGTRQQHVHYLHYMLPEQKTVATRLISRLLSRTDCLVGNSEATLQRVRLHRDLRARSVVIRQGFDRVSPLADAPPGPDWVIGSAGRLDPIKNYELIIDAAKLIRARHPNLRIRLVGAAYTEADRRYEARLKKHIEQQGMKDIVTLGGFTHDIWSFMDSLQVFMLCSYTESFGRVLAEAMWSGKPIIATRVGAVPEIVQNGVTGYTVGTGDVPEAARLLELLINNPEHGLQLGRAGRAYAEENLCYRSYIAAWEQCLRTCR